MVPNGPTRRWATQRAVARRWRFRARIGRDRRIHVPIQIVLVFFVSGIGEDRQEGSRSPLGRQRRLEESSSAPYIDRSCGEGRTEKYALVSVGTRCYALLRLSRVRCVSCLKAKPCLGH